MSKRPDYKMIAGAANAYKAKSQELQTGLVAVSRILAEIYTSLKKAEDDGTPITLTTQDIHDLCREHGYDIRSLVFYADFMP